MSQPLFFGNANEQLFGIYHPPRQKIGTKAVLLCNPIGQEQIRSYRCLRQLADRLSAAGLHVFRFDYYGTGDSWGSMDDASVQKWVSNVGQAADELKAMSAVNRISVLGIRFGAVLAAIASKERCDIAKLYLWDPVTDGRAYLDELQTMQDELLRDPDRFSEPRSAGDIGKNELIGFPMPDGLSTAISAIDSSYIREIKAAALCVLDTQQNTVYGNVFANLVDAESTGELLHIDAPMKWNDVAQIEIAFMATEVVDCLAEKLP